MNPAWPRSVTCLATSPAGRLLAIQPCGRYAARQVPRSRRDRDGGDVVAGAVGAGAVDGGGGIVVDAGGGDISGTEELVVVEEELVVVGAVSRCSSSFGASSGSCRSSTLRSRFCVALLASLTYIVSRSSRTEEPDESMTPADTATVVTANSAVTTTSPATARRPSFGRRRLPLNPSPRPCIAPHIGRPPTQLSSRWRSVARVSRTWDPGRSAMAPVALLPCRRREPKRDCSRACPVLRRSPDEQSWTFMFHNRDDPPAAWGRQHPAGITSTTSSAETRAPADRPCPGSSVAAPTRGPWALSHRRRRRHDER